MDSKRNNKASKMSKRDNKNWQGMNWIRQDKRLAIYLRDGMACMWCGATVEDGATLSLDHIKPASQGGSNSERNLVCSCMTCNTRRSDRDATVWAEIVAAHCNHGLTGEAIMAAVRSNTRKSLKEYRIEAKQLIARRGSAAKAIAAK